MTQAIMTFYSENVWSKRRSQPVKRLLHWVLQATGSSMAIIGMIIQYVNRRSHFQTKHSIVGLIAGIFTLIAMVNGMSALWSVEMRKYVSPVYSKFFHLVVGLTAFVLGEWQRRWINPPFWKIKTSKIMSVSGMVALFFGYDRKYMIKNSQEGVRMSLQALAIITIILSLIGAMRTLKHYTKTILRL